MINFLKKNAKVIAIVGVSGLVAAGLTTTLFVTSVASAEHRGKGSRDRNSARMERLALTDEQIAERAERAEQRVQSRNSERAERADMTEEQLAERKTKAVERLRLKLAANTITQEEFDEKIAAIESGEYTFGKGSKKR